MTCNLVSISVLLFFTLPFYVLVKVICLTAFPPDVCVCVCVYVGKGKGSEEEQEPCGSGQRETAASAETRGNLLFPFFPFEQIKHLGENFVVWIKLSTFYSLDEAFPVRN